MREKRGSWNMKAEVKRNVQKFHFLNYFINHLFFFSAVVDSTTRKKGCLHLITFIVLPAFRIQILFFFLKRRTSLTRFSIIQNFWWCLALQQTVFRLHEGNKLFFFFWGRERERGKGREKAEKIKFLNFKLTREFRKRKKKLSRRLELEKTKKKLYSFFFLTKKPELQKQMRKAIIRLIRQNIFSFSWKKNFFF